MSRPLSRTTFNSAQLIRRLARLTGEEAAASKQSLAERLGEWLDLSDAIALFGALNTRPGNLPGDPLQKASDTCMSVQEEFSRVRASLTESITTDGVFQPGKVRIKLPAPPAGATAEAAANFLPYRRYYLAHQRDMESNIGLLRDHLRAALANRSPALNRLATLDATLDKALGERERNLLATVPQFVEKHFEQLRKAHQDACVETQQTDSPDLWMQPGGWLATFCRDMRGVLLAELDVRLQPALGLMEALIEKK